MFRSFETFSEIGTNNELKSFDFFTCFDHSSEGGSEHAQEKNHN